jgi:hypothetical protein
MNKVEPFLGENQIYQYQTNGFVNGGPLIIDDMADHLAARIEQVISDKDNPDVPKPTSIQNVPMYNQYADADSSKTIG